MNFKNCILLSTILLTASSSHALSSPNPTLTPGVLCTSTDPNFEGYAYAEHIARCNRNVSQQEKLDIAKNYGDIPQSQWSNFEFDHFIPLCAGGSDDIKNLWPQPIAEAHKKDGLENQICLAMQAGTMTQAQAVQKVHDWFPISGTAPAPAVIAESSAKINCVETHPRNDQPTALTAHFDVIDDTHITNVSLDLVDGSEHEVINTGSEIILGKSTKATAGPLKDLNHYTMKSGNDRFYLYLTDQLRSQKITAYVKVSYEGTYPNLTEMDCK